MKKIIWFILVIGLLCNGCDTKNSTIPTDNTLNSIHPSIPSTTLIPSDQQLELISQIATSMDSQYAISPLQLDDDYYLFSSNIWFGSNNTYTIVNSEGEVIRTFYNVILNNQSIGQIDRKTPLILGISTYEKVDSNVNNPDNSDNFEYGLYLPSTNSFIINPKYDTLSQYGTNLYGGIKDNQLTFFDINGGILSDSISTEHYKVQKVGNYIWHFPNKEGNIYVYNQELKLIRELDCSNGTGYTYGDGYVIWESRETGDEFSMELLDSSGELFISKEILARDELLPDDLDANITQINYYTDTELFVIYSGPYQLLIDMDFKLIDRIDNTINVDQYFVIMNQEYYKYSNGINDSDIILYNVDGEEILDNSGNHYNGSLGNYDVYRYDDNILYIYNYNTEVEYAYSVPGYTIPYVLSPSEGLYMIQNRDLPNQLSVYYKESLVFKEDNYNFSHLNYGSLNDYQILCPISDSYEEAVINTIINNAGKVVYTSPYKEMITNINDNYIQVIRGNYLGLVDFKGDFVFKMLNPQLGDD